MKILKKLKLILIILGIVVIALGIILFIKIKNNNSKQQNDYGLDIENIVSNDLYNKSITEFQKIYPSTYDFEISSDDSKIIYIQSLIDEYSYDTSYLKSYTCDFEKSYFIIFMENGEQKIGINLQCE